jgi:tetratricopeptide (TPR) repeat protein/predicted aspartyl protease
MLCAVGRAAAAGCRIERYPAIPVTMKNMQALIRVKINGKPAILAVDSGASFSLLSPEGARRFKLTYLYAPPGLRLGGVGGVTQPELVSARTFSFNDQRLHDVQFLVAGNDYFSHAAGLLGDNLLRMADVEFDFAKGFMRFVVPVHCGNLPLAYWAGSRPVGMLELHRVARLAPQFIGSARLDGHRITVMFDTGAARSVLSLSMAERLRIGPGDPGVKPAGRMGGITRRLVRSWIAPLARLQIGGETIEHTHVMVVPMPQLSAAADLVLGADFFLAHHVYIANSQHKIYFTYNGGPVFALGQPAPAFPTHAAGARSGAAATAADLIRRGMAARAREEYPQALADFKRACRLDATDARCFVYSGQTHLAADQPAAALSDFKSALRLEPRHYPALLGSAAARLALRRFATAPTWRALTAAAAADLAAASRAMRPDSVAHMMLGTLANQAGAFPLAVDAFNAWLRYHRGDIAAPTARNGLCWAWAAENRHLHRALRDCNRALVRVPGSTAVLDSRGLVDLRLGRLRRALHDYDAALAAHPHRPLPLYGRGLAELRLGKTAAARADFTAAQRIAPDTARRYAQFGLAP